MPSARAWILCAVVAAVALAVVHAVGYDSVLLSEVKMVPLSSGKMTTGRRSAPVPQLMCEGSLCSRYQPTSVLCKNMGSDGSDAVWECTDPAMPSEFVFGSVTVNCEGYNYPDDPYILKGSCGLEYTLAPNPQYSSPSSSSSHYKQQYSAPFYASPYAGSSSHVASAGSSSMTWGTIVMLVIIGLIGLLICGALNQNSGAAAGAGGNNGGGGGAPGGPGFPQRPSPSPPANNNNNGGAGGGGGAGWNSGWKSTPADGSANVYPHAPRYAGGYGAGAAAGPAMGSAGVFPSSVTPNTASGPGFWSGMAAGAAASYLMNRGSNNSQSDNARPAPPSYGGGGGFFGGGSSSSGAAAPASRPASGFGTTKRR